MLLALFSDLQLLFERLLTRLNGGNSISLESFEILSPSSIHPLFLTLPGKYQEYVLQSSKVSLMAILNFYPKITK